MKTIGVAFLAALTTAALPAASAAADALPQPPAQAITWGACKPVEDLPAELRTDGLQCGQLSVPLNYADPAGARISLAVIRKPASIKAGRAGSIVFNPGGPGGSGVEFLQTALLGFEGDGDPVMAKLGKRFDLVSFDPRGVGASSPPKCGKYKDPSARGVPTIAQAAADIKPFVAGCSQQSAALLPFLSTADVARDLEQLRASLGDPKLNFLGYSYGTYLGATYAALFPSSVGKFVLDGAVDPEHYTHRPLQFDLEQAASGEKTLKRFLKSTKKAGKRLSLKGYRRLVSRLDRKPLRVNRRQRITGDDVRSFVNEGLATRLTWPFMAMGLDEIKRGRPDVFASMFAAGASVAESQSFITGFLGNAGADRGGNPAEVTDAYVASMRAAAPDIADATWPGTLATAMWPHAAGRFTGPWTYPASAGSSPILVIGTRFDPRTPYAGAVALRQQLGNAHLITFEGDGHTAFNNAANGGCIDNHVIAYFTTAVGPGDGAICTQDEGIDEVFKDLADDLAEAGLPTFERQSALAHAARRSG